MSTVPEALTQDDCCKILHNYTKGSDCKLTSYKIRPLSNTKEGFIGEHYIIEINYEDDKSESFFLKILDGTFKVIHDLSMSINAYDKEEFYYTLLLKDFRKYDIDIDFAPENYLCKPYLIVLENLSAQGYKSLSKLQFSNLVHCKASIDTLAKFHTSSIVYETIKTNETATEYRLLDVYPECLEEKLFSKEENAASRWFQHSIEGIIRLTELIPENHINAEQFQSKLQEVLTSFVHKETKPKTKTKECVLHGDLWSNNFLYLYENGVPVHAKLIDYQIIKYGCPSEDVVQYIFANTRKQFRDDHFEELLNYYYERLRDCLEKYRIDISGILPIDDFLRNCEDIKIAMKIKVIADRCITFMPEDVIGEAFESEENLSKFIFEERSNIIVKSFRKEQEFRDLITEDMLELRDMLS